MMKRLVLSWSAVNCLLAFVLPLANGDEPSQASPPPTRHRITGLFAPERERDLRELVATLPGLELVRIDFDRAEAEFHYDGKTLFPGAKPEHYVQRLDNLLRTSSFGTFGAAPLSTTSLDDVVTVEIPVAGLDCKGCCLAAYESIYKIEGVLQATASFREGRVVAKIDPARTNRQTLTEALKKKGIEIPPPP